MKRPWIVRVRARGRRWWVAGTYATESAATAALLRYSKKWAQRGYAFEGYVRHRDTLLPVSMDDAKHASGFSGF